MYDLSPSLSSLSLSRSTVHVHVHVQVHVIQGIKGVLARREYCNFKLCVCFLQFFMLLIKDHFSTDQVCMNVHCVYTGTCVGIIATITSLFLFSSFSQSPFHHIPHISKELAVSKVCGLGRKRLTATKYFNTCTCTRPTSCMQYLHVYYIYSYIIIPYGD